MMVTKRVLKNYKSYPHKMQMLHQLNQNDPDRKNEFYGVMTMNTELAQNL